MIILNDEQTFPYSENCGHFFHIRPIRVLDLLDESGEYGMNREYLRDLRGKGKFYLGDFACEPYVLFFCGFGATHMGM